MNRLQFLKLAKSMQGYCNDRKQYLGLKKFLIEHINIENKDLVKEFNKIWDDSLDLQELENRYREYKENWEKAYRYLL